VSALDSILSGLRDLIVMREELSRIGDTARELASDVRDHEKRLIRIETMIEMTRGNSRPALPPE